MRKHGSWPLSQNKEVQKARNKYVMHQQEVTMLQIQEKMRKQVLPQSPRKGLRPKDTMVLILLRTCRCLTQCVCFVLSHECFGKLQWSSVFMLWVHPVFCSKYKQPTWVIYILTIVSPPFSPPSSPPHLLSAPPHLHFYSQKGNPLMDIIKTWHIKLQ